MKFTIQRLTSQLLPLAVEIFTAQRQVGKQQLSSSELERGLEALRGSLKSQRTVTWMAFNEAQQLVAYLVQTFPACCSNHWLMSFLVTNPMVPAPWNYQRNGMDALWLRAISFGRYYDCQNILWSLPTAWARTTSRTQKTSAIWPRFEIYPFGEVKAGELPTSEFDRAVFGNHPKPYDVTLRCAWPAAHPGRDLLQRVRSPAFEAAHNVLPG